MIRWFVGLWDRKESPLVLASVRILVGACILWDFLEAAWLGIVPTLWGPDTQGGLAANLMEREPLPEIYLWFPETMATPVVVYQVFIAAAFLFMIGAGTRVSGLVTLLLYAQLSRILPLGDRGIDLMLRNVILLLVLSRSHAMWSVDAWLRTRRWSGDGTDIPAWPRHLLILQLVVMYFFAGIQKTAIAWLPLGGYSALFVILQDPHIARFDMAWLANVYPLTQVSTAVTHIWENSALAVLLVYYWRDTHQRGGRIRTFVQKWRPHWWWIGLGVLLHIGIALSMNLGIFPWAMLALYPAWFHPEELRKLTATGRSLVLGG